MNTYLLWFVSVLLLTAPVYSADTCKKFLCKSFNKGDTDICVLVNTEAKTDQLVRKCDADKGCEATQWFTVAAASTNATCKAGGTDPVKNMTKPGDLCDKAEECYGDAAKVSCDTVCKTTVKVGDYCETADAEHPGNWWCPVGTYCENKKCVDQKKEGDVCTAAAQCTTGFNCVKVNDAKDSVCTKYWTLKAGDKFDPTAAMVRDAILPLSAVCESHWAFRPDDAQATYVCRDAPTNNNATDLSDLKKTAGPGTACEFTAHDDKDDATKAVPKTGSAKCGFNKDDAAYCDKQQGDKWFQDQLKALKATKYADLKCHSASTLFKCGDAANVIGDKLYKKFYRELISTPEGIMAPDGTGYALYANNDKCVADSITMLYWQGDSPDFAFHSFSIVSFASIMITISALFFMF